MVNAVSSTRRESLFLVTLVLAFGCSTPRPLDRPSRAPTTDSSPPAFSLSPESEEQFYTSLLRNDQQALRSLLDSQPRLIESPLVLHAAVFYGEALFVRLLLRSSASDSKLRAFNDSVPPDRFLPLHMAAALGRHNVVKLLLDSGANPNAESADGHTVLHMAAGQVDKRAFADIFYRDYSEILSYVAIILNPDAPRPSQEQMLELFQAKLRFENGHGKVISAALDHGANINAKDHRDQTPLSRAASFGHAELVEILVASGADLESRDSMGYAPLHNASERGHEKVVATLLAKGATVDCRTDKRNTPLHLAVTSGDEKSVELLLEAGANIEAREHNGSTVLSTAAAMGHDTLVRSLLNRGANPRARNRSNRTALHYAAAKLPDRYFAASQDTAARTTKLRMGLGHARCAELLLASGADAEARDKLGQTPFAVAVRTGRLDVAGVLERHISQKYDTSQKKPSTDR